MDVSAIAPGAPDGAEGAVGRGGHLKSLADHEAAVFGQGAVVVALMDGDEGVQSVEALAGIEGLLALVADRYGRMRCVRHGDRQFDEARDRLDVAYGEAYVFSPDIDDGSASAVVAGVHPQIVLLVEAGIDGDDPVGALFVGAALVGPESWGCFGCGDAKAVVIVRPSEDLERRGSLVGVFDFEDCHRGEVVVDGYCDFLLQSAVFAGYGEALAGAEGVGDLVGLCGG